MRALYLLFAIPLVASCAKTPPKPAEPEDLTGPPPAVSTMTEADYLELSKSGVSDELKNTMEVRHYEFRFSEIQELPEVRMDLFNLLEDQELNLQIRTVFFRADGSVIDELPWTPATIRPRSTLPYRGVAFSPFAVREQVQLRNVHPAPYKPAVENSTP